MALRKLTRYSKSGVKTAKADSNKCIRIYGGRPLIRRTMAMCGRFNQHSFIYSQRKPRSSYRLCQQCKRKIAEG